MAQRHIPSDPHVCPGTAYKCSVAALGFYLGVGFILNSYLKLSFSEELRKSVALQTFDK